MTFLPAMLPPSAPRTLALQLTEAWPLWLILPAAALLTWGLLKTLTDRAPAKRHASFALRLLAVVLLALALTRPTLNRPVDRLHAVFVLDLSASVDLADARRALTDIDTAIDALNPGDSHSLFTVGNTLRHSTGTQAIAETLDRWDTGATDDRFRAGTDLAAALRAARLTVPDDAATRLVLFTDARPTTGDLTEALAQLQTEGVQIQHRELAGLSDPEIAIASLSASPAFAHEGEVVRLSASVAANHTGPAELRIVHRGVIVSRQDVDLVAGETKRVDINVPMLTPGRTVWTAEIAPKALPASATPDQSRPAPDHFTVNNAVSTTVHVTGRPRVLVLHEKTRDMSAFANAMERQDLVVEVRPAAGAPRTLDELLAFDAVVLSDIPATDLSPAQLELLKRFVADFGGGLAMLGSENSFGLGGYYRTAVEEVLPLSSRFEQEKEQPSMAMVLVIDKSGSMDGQPIALARQAAKAAVELLSPRDQIGVVGFDGQAFIALPMSSASDREGAKAAIDRIGAGGGTFMFAGMDAAREMLETTAARIKHMIVLGDGQSQVADHAGLTRDLADAGVTVSTVALGAGADQALLAQIAEIGRGRYYLTMDPSSVPQIFTRETMQASRSAIKEDLFAAVHTGDHPLLAGYENAELPFTLGYVMTRARPTAQVLLTTDTGDPLLAINPYGLGQGLSFTGDLTPRWGGEWLAWPGFGKFWSQALRALVRRPNQSELSVQTTASPTALHIQLTEPSAAARAADRAAAPAPWRAESLNDTGHATAIPVRAVGVGRYEANVPLANADRITVRLHNPAGNQLRTVQYDRPYPAEYLLSARPDPALSAAGPFTPQAIRKDLPVVTATTALSPWLLLLAILSFTGGVLLRRL